MSGLVEMGSDIHLVSAAILTVISAAIWLGGGVDINRDCGGMSICIYTVEIGE